MSMDSQSSIKVLLLCLVSFVRTNNGEQNSTNLTLSRPPCHVGAWNSFTRQAYSLSINRLAASSSNSHGAMALTQLAICPGLAIPCSGMLTAWRMNLIRQATVNKTIVGVWRKESPVSGRYVLVGSTPIRDPNDDKASFIFPGFLQITLAKRERFFVRKGDFIGVHYADSVQQPTIAYLTSSDALSAGLITFDCIVMANKPKKSVNRELSWTNGVTVLDGDAVVEARTYALTAEIESAELGERCSTDSDCPVNARCYTLSCTEQFCLCKPDYLPSRDGKTCRHVVAVGSRCNLLPTPACAGELDVPTPSAFCNRQYSRCQCQEGYSHRAPYNYKCRPNYNDEGGNATRRRFISAVSTLSTTYGLLGDDCSNSDDEDDENEDDVRSSIAPCWRTAGLECRNRQCVCRHGYRPKTALERVVYPNSLEECVLETETAVGCFTTKIRPKPPPTTTPTAPSTTKPDCYSTYTCWLLALKQQAMISTTTAKDERGLMGPTKTQLATTTTAMRVRTTTTSPIHRIGERCANETECPDNALCYPFTCENFICTCRLGYTPSNDYRKCVKEIDIGAACVPKNATRGVCRGSQLLAGSISDCTKRRCDCTSPYSSVPDAAFNDRGGYCRMTIPTLENDTSSSSKIRVYGRLDDACNQTRPCYPPTTTLCIDGRCQCSPGYREKLPLEYGYLPDRSSQCISKVYQIGCDKLLEPTSTTEAPTTEATTNNRNRPSRRTTSRQPLLTTLGDEEITNSTTAMGPTAGEANMTTIETAMNNATFSTMPFDDTEGNTTTTTNDDANYYNWNETKTTSPTVVIVTSSADNNVSSSSSSGSNVTTMTTRRTTPRTTITTTTTIRTVTLSSTPSTTTRPFPKPVTLSSLSYDSKGWMQIWVPIVVVICVAAIAFGVGIYLCTFRPKLPFWKKKVASPLKETLRTIQQQNRSRQKGHHNNNHQHHQHPGRHQHRRSSSKGDNRRAEFPMAEAYVQQWAGSHKQHYRSRSPPPKYYR